MLDLNDSYLVDVYSRVGLWGCWSVVMLSFYLLQLPHHCTLMIYI